MSTAYTSIGVVGAGAWGTALATTLGRVERNVTLWAREEDVVSAINTQHENSIFLPEVPLSHNITATNNIADLAACEALLLVIPAQFTRGVCKALAKQQLPNDIPLILCSKGIEDSTGSLVNEVVEEELPGHPVAILSGPSFAKEVAEEQPTALSLACRDLTIANRIHASFENSNLALYIIDDIVGAEIGGSVKNPLAIACGIAAGLELGDNVHAALIALGLKEMGRLAEVKGGRRETLLELCGTGDTVLTCSSLQSRNMSLGFALGQGKTLDTILAERQSVTEGIATSKSINDLAEKLAIPMPICSSVYRILHENQSPNSIIDLLSNVT